MSLLIKPYQFTPISNEIIAHKQLSFGAKAVYSYLQMRPADWQFYLGEIASNFSESERLVSRALRQLEEFKYLVRIRKRQSNGRFSNYDYYLFNTQDEYKYYIASQPDLFADYDNNLNANQSSDPFTESTVQIAKSNGKINISTTCTLPPVVNRRYNNKDITKKEIYKEKVKNKNKKTNNNFTSNEDNLFSNYEQIGATKKVGVDERASMDEKASMDVCVAELGEPIVNVDPNKEKPTLKSSTTFKKPSSAEVKAYCQERNNKVNPEEFISYYETVDWHVGKNKMKDWRAAIRYWESKQSKYNESKQQQKPPYGNNNFYKKPEVTSENLLKEIEQLASSADVNIRECV
jgi:hypothetical protein